MSLTRKLLKEMDLAEDQIEQIILAHADTISALKAEIAQAKADCDSANEEKALLLEKLSELSHWQEEAQRVQSAFDAYKEQAAQAQSDAEKQQLIRQALIDAGANEKALDLLSRLIDPAALDIQEGKLANAQALVDPIRETYGAFFAQPVLIPTPTIQPPASSHGALRVEDIARMSSQEINANWAAVRSVLAHH